MTFWGTTWTGEKLLLGDPAEAVLSYDADAPADLLRVKFPADKLWEELCEVTMEENGKTVFRGIVDEQNTSLSAAGVTVELICRSMEAILLDNEAPPMTLLSPSLEALELRLLAPLGLRLGEGDRQPKRGRLVIGKGESCWAVLARFCREWLGTEPFVDHRGTVHCIEKEEKELELDRVISARVELLPCKRIGEVWQQSCRGSYDTPYRNSRSWIRRRRYVSMESGKDPHRLIEQGDRDSFLLTVTCAGTLWPVRGARVTAELPELGRFEDCPVRSARYFRDASGDHTRLVLERGPEREKKEEGLCG